MNRPGKFSGSVAEAATHVGLSERTITNLINNGTVREVKFGSKRLVIFADLEAYVESLVVPRGQVSEVVGK